MTYFLRNNKNHTILDLEFWTKTDYESSKNDKHKYHEVSAYVEINNYSKFLLDNLDKKDDIIQTFDRLSEYRGWLWENYYMTGKNTGNEKEGDKIQKLISEDLQEVAKRFDLYYVTD